MEKPMIGFLITPLLMLVFVGYVTTRVMISNKQTHLAQQQQRKNEALRKKRSLLLQPEPGSGTCARVVNNQPRKKSY